MYDYKMLLMVIVLNLIKWQFGWGGGGLARKAGTHASVLYFACLSLSNFEYSYKIFSRFCTFRALNSEGGRENLSCFKRACSRHLIWRMSILLFDLMLYILPISLLIKMGCFQKVVVLNDTHFFPNLFEAPGNFL